MWMPVLGHLQRSQGFVHLVTVTFAIWTWAHNDLISICWFIYFFLYSNLLQTSELHFLGVSGNNPPRDSREDSALICRSSLIKLELLAAGVAWASRPGTKDNTVTQKSLSNKCVSVETLKYSFYLLECSGKEFPSLAREFGNNLMFLFTWSIFLNYFLKRRRVSFVMQCPGLLQDFFYLRIFLVCGRSGDPR